jgi:hypothetical protein
LEIDMGLLSTIKVNGTKSTGIKFNDALLQSAHMDAAQTLEKLTVTLDGLSSSEVEKKLPGKNASPFSNACWMS